MDTRRALLLLLLALAGPQPAQEAGRRYGWPLAIRDGVSSAFGEFRTNHFHAGIDMRTLQRTGFPVLAVADGWIESISVSNRGYGRLLRLRHQDGNASLYGHLQRFRPDVEAVVGRVRASGGARYFSAHVLDPPVAVRRGEVIAFSGESGAGFAHLHLEIRDGENRSLNPLRLIDDLAPDELAPIPRGVLLRSRGGTLVDGDCGEFYFQLRLRDGVYTLERPLVLSGACDLALDAIDLSDVGHRLAPAVVEASLDGRPVIGLRFTHLSRDDNNQLGMVYDMAYSTPGCYFFNLCSQAGFALEATGGRLADELAGLAPGRHEVRVVVADAAGNRSLAVLPLLKVAPVTAGARGASAARNDALRGMAQSEFVAFANHGDVVAKLKDYPGPASDIRLRVRQGEQEQLVPASECSSGVYFVFKPLNHALRMLLSFERSEGGLTVEAWQRTLLTVLLQPDQPQTVSYRDFTADFGATSVHEPTALLLEPVALQPELPLLAGPMRTGPVHFAFFDDVRYKFRVPAGAGRLGQLGIFKYSPESRRWTYVTSRLDRAAEYVSARVLTAGTFALLRDVFPPAVSLRRLGTRRLARLKHVFVRLHDKGKGIDDASIIVILNGRRVEGDFDSDWGHFELADLSALRRGPNVLKVRAGDLAGNLVEKAFSFTLK